MVRKISPLILLLLSVIGISAQSTFQDNYTPIPTADTMYKKVVLKYIKDRYAHLADSLSKGSHDKKKIYTEIYGDKYDFIEGHFDEDYLYWDDTLTNALRRIVEKIVKANPELGKKKYLFTNRTSVPNAFSLGDDLVFFNLGLLSRLDNEGEVAYVLGHELAHDKLNHVTQKIQKHVETVTNKDYKRKVETASKSEFNAFHQVEGIMKGTLFDFNKHGREFESIADSLGVVWMSRAGYSPIHAIEALKQLDSCDNEKYDEPIKYKEIFSDKDFAFKDAWLHQEEFLVGFKSKEELDDDNNDTLKTHPDCQKRIKDIQNICAHNASLKGADGDESYKGTVNIMADFEIVQHQYEHKGYAASMFNALHLLQHYPNNIYLKAMVAKDIYFLQKALKDHEFSKYTDLPNPYFDKNYNQFLNFINNLRSSELAALGINFVKKNAITNADPQFEFASILCLSMDPKTTSVENLVINYLHTFPQSAESDYLKNKLLTKKN